MRTLLGVLLLTGLLGLSGCGGKRAEAPAANETPLSLEEWRRIEEPHVKFDPETFERLKKANPRLRTQEGWNSFANSVLKARQR